MTTNRHAYQTMRLLTFFLMIGLAGAALLSRLIGSLLFGISQVDVATYAGVTRSVRLMVRKPSLDPVPSPY